MSLTEIPTDTDRNGIEPKIWGKSIWETLHYVSMDFPAKPSPLEVSRFFVFFESLMTVLPCETCREHYEAYWKTHPIGPYLAAGTLKQWVLELHNAVNRRLNKPTWTLAEIEAKYGGGAEEEGPGVFSLMVGAGGGSALPTAPAPAAPPKPNRKKVNHRIRRNFGAHDLSTALPVGPKKKCKNCGKK